MILNRSAPITSESRNRTWKEHYELHVNPDLMTRLLRKSVPILEALQWRVTEVREGFTASVLPLTSESTNQHGTHQAALIGLAGDYTGGLALASLLTGVPLAGIHQCFEEESASLWLADMSVRFRAPSTGHLEVTCQIPPSFAKKIADRYFTGKRVFTTLPVLFHSNGELVAEAEMKYFAQPSIHLRPSDNTHVSPIFKTKLKASARLIAGVRSQTPNCKRIRIDCPHTRLAASAHGKLLADRLRRALPQLTDMVHARTQHADDTLRSIPGLKQVLLIGAGLDMRPYRLYREKKSITWFELDLPVMLEERQRVVSQFSLPPPIRRRPIAIDLHRDCVADLVKSHPDFDPAAPTLIIYEGCSMYFEQSTNVRILQACRTVLEHPDSRLWVDIVARSVIDGTSEFDEVKRFIRGMDELGERFIFGHDVPVQLMTDCGFQQMQVTLASNYLESTDSVFALYRFVVAR